MYKLSENKKSERKLPDIRVLTVYNYFDSAIYVKDEKGRIDEKNLFTSDIHFGVIPETVENDIDVYLNYVRGTVREHTMADTVIVTFYQMFVKRVEFQNLVNSFSHLSEEEVILRLWRDSILSEKTVIVRGAFKIGFQERFSIDNKNIS